MESPIQTDFRVRFSPLEGMPKLQRINDEEGSREFVIAELVKGRVVVESFSSSVYEANFITTIGAHGLKIRRLVQALGRIGVIIVINAVLAFIGITSWQQGRENVIQNQTSPSPSP